MQAKLSFDPRTALGLVLGLVSFAALAVLDQQNGTLRAGVTPQTITWLSIAFVGFLLAVWGNERRPVSPAVLWGAAIVFRLLMLTTDPSLSDDVFRYLWDGHLLTEGVNPYSHPISASALDPHEIDIRRLANNPHLASPYLPTAQLLFAGVAAALPLQALSIQVVMTVFDLGTGALIGLLLKRAGLPWHRMSLYLWHPLVVVELAHAAHLDALMAFLALASIALTVKGKPAVGTDGDTATVRGLSRWAWLSPLLLAASVLTRPLPLLFAPMMWWRWTWGQRILFGLSTVALLVPFSFGRSGLGLASATEGTGLFGSARVYANDFRFNSGLPHWAEGMFGQNSIVVSLGTVVIMGVVGLAVWWCSRADLATNSNAVFASDLARQMRLAAVPLMAYALLTPVFHPWYLILLLVMLPFIAPHKTESPRRWVLLAPWLSLSALLPLSYLTYVDPLRFAEQEWIRRTEWIPTLALAAVATGVALSLQRTTSDGDRGVRPS